MAEIRVPRTDEIDALFDLSIQAFNPPRSLLEARRPTLPLDEFLVAVEDGRVLGSARAMEMPHWFGGRLVPGAGVASVAVAADARGRGLAKQIMVPLLERERAAGRVISTLFPATVPIYRSLGYGFGPVYAEWKLELRDLPRGRAPASAELFSSHEEIDAAYQRFASQRNGMSGRPAHYWKRIFEGTEPPYSYLVRENGEVTGWIIYSLQRRSDTDWASDAHVRDLVWFTPNAARALFSLLANHQSTVKHLFFVGHPSAPFGELLEEDRRQNDGVFRSMITLLDVPGALEARGYIAGLNASVSVRVTGSVFGDNEGPWEIAVSGGRAKVAPASNADAVVDISTFSSIWASATLPADAARDGFLEAGDDALASLTAIFAGPAPWTTDYF